MTGVVGRARGGLGRAAAAQAAGAALPHRRGGVGGRDDRRARRRADDRAGADRDDGPRHGSADHALFVNAYGATPSANGEVVPAMRALAERYQVDHASVVQWVPGRFRAGGATFDSQLRWWTSPTGLMHRVAAGRRRLVRRGRRGPAGAGARGQRGLPGGDRLAGPGDAPHGDPARAGPGHLRRQRRRWRTGGPTRCPTAFALYDSYTRVAGAPDLDPGDGHGPPDGAVGPARDGRPRHGDRAPGPDRGPRRGRDGRRRAATSSPTRTLRPDLPARRARHRHARAPARRAEPGEHLPRHRPPAHPRDRHPALLRGDVGPGVLLDHARVGRGDGGGRRRRRRPRGRRRAEPPAGVRGSASACRTPRRSRSRRPSPGSRPRRAWGRWRGCCPPSSPCGCARSTPSGTDGRPPPLGGSASSAGLRRRT